MWQARTQSANMPELSEYDKGRIDGAMVYWSYFAQDDQVAVPAVDRMLKLPEGTTRNYLDNKEKS